MTGTALALSLAIAVIQTPAARSASPAITPSLDFSGGWTDNANGGVEESGVGRPAVAAPFMLVEPGLRVSATPVARLSAGAGYRAGIERYRACAVENALAHRVDGTITLATNGPAWTVEGSWDRKDYAAARDTLAYRAGRGGVSAAWPLGGDRETTVTAAWGLTQWSWPDDRYPVDADGTLAGRSDLTNAGRLGVRQRLGTRVVAGVQVLYASNRSRALVDTPAGPRERFSWAGPGAVMTVGVAPAACALLTVATQVQERGYRDWLAGTPPARVTGSVLAVAVAGVWACSRAASVIVEYSILRLEAADPALRLRAQRVSLGIRFAPRLPL